MRTARPPTRSGSSATTVDRLEEDDLADWFANMGLDRSNAWISLSELDDNETARSLEGGDKLEDRLCDGFDAAPGVSSGLLFSSVTRFEMLDPRERRPDERTVSASLSPKYDPLLPRRLSLGGTAKLELLVALRCFFDSLWWILIASLWSLSKSSAHWVTGKRCFAPRVLISCRVFWSESSTLVMAPRN